jgi:hypothetical protein
MGVSLLTLTDLAKIVSFRIVLGFKRIKLWMFARDCDLSLMLFLFGCRSAQSKFIYYSIFGRFMFPLRFVAMAQFNMPIHRSQQSVSASRLGIQASVVQAASGRSFLVSRGW